MALNAFRNARSAPSDVPPEAPKDNLGELHGAELPQVDENLHNLEGQRVGGVNVVADDKDTGEVVLEPTRKTDPGDPQA